MVYCNCIINSAQCFQQKKNSTPSFVCTPCNGSYDDAYELGKHQQWCRQLKIQQGTISKVKDAHDDMMVRMNHVKLYLNKILVLLSKFHVNYVV
jgi:hypothetical protein